MSKIATMSDAYNVGGTMPSGYVANKCCTEEKAVASGCMSTGYASKRLVPENLLEVEAAPLTLYIETQGDSIFYDYYVQCRVNDADSGYEYYYGYLGDMSAVTGNYTDIDLEIPQGTRLNVAFFDCNYRYSTGAAINSGGYMSLDTYPSNATILENNSRDTAELEFTMEDSCDIIISLSE